MSKRGGKKDTKHKEHINKYANKKQGSKKDWDNFARQQTNYGLVNKARLQLTELLLEHYPYEKKETMEHLDFAIKEFQEMKMKPSLERALRHKNILKA